MATKKSDKYVQALLKNPSFFKTVSWRYNSGQPVSMLTLAKAVKDLDSAMEMAFKDEDED